MTTLEKNIKRLSGTLSTTMSKLADHVTPKGVHRLRTSIRRIESLVSYAHPELGKKQERALEELATLRKRAGKVRDFDVQIKLLEEIANGSAGADRRALAEVLDKKRSRQAKKLQAAVKAADGHKFFGRLEHIAEKSVAQPEEASRPLAPLEEAKAQLTQLATEFSSRQPLKSGRLHQARIKLKLLRYLAELAEESDEQQAFLRRLKSVQDAVGDWHDWEELAASAEKQFKDRINCALLMEVRSLLAAQYTAAASAIGQLFATYAVSLNKKAPRSISPTHRTMARSA